MNMAAPGSCDPCLIRWIEANNDIIATWKRQVDQCRDAHTESQKLRERMDQLLKLMRDLPPVVPFAALELTVTYNLVIMELNADKEVKEEHERLIDETLRRVLAAHHLDPGGDHSCSALWRTALRAESLVQQAGIVHGLAGLQGLIWSVQKKSPEVLDLFQTFSTFPVTDRCALLLLLRSWAPPDEGSESIHCVLRPSFIKDIVYTAVAFQQGVEAMEKGDHDSALDLFQEAAGCCGTKSFMARIRNCQGLCFIQKGLPHLALEHFKQALQEDPKCGAAYYNCSVAYRRLGKREAEVEMLHLLKCVLSDPKPAAPSPRGHGFSPISSEDFVDVRSLSCASLAPRVSELQYLLARHCFEYKMMDEAADNYVELLRDLMEGSDVELGFPSPAPLPPVAEILLEAAACLIQVDRFEEAAAACEEVIVKTADVIPSRILLDRTKERDPVITDQLNCIVWVSAAHLFQAKIQALQDETKTSISSYSRCVNLLLKVQFSGADAGNESLTSPREEERDVIDTLKCCALIGRSHQFLQLGNLKEALKNASLGLQVLPACPEANNVFLSSLWKMERKKEAEAHWQKFKSSKSRTDDQWQSVKRSLPLSLHEFVNHKFFTNQTSIREIRECLGS
uniref:FA complementation group G n=1 Tax=Leptobrachium leishanense TaxID=445787 RepID=A0A8C5P6Z2_9ANUR